MKKKDENQNPYHKEYGLLDNMRYIMSNMLKYVPKMRRIKKVSRTFNVREILF